MLRNDFEFKVGGILIIVIAFVLIFYNVSYYGNDNTYQITVTDKYVKNGSDSGNYMIVGELQDTKELKSFEDADLLLKGKFDSSDLYAHINVGEQYEIKTVGWRIPFLSDYENIYEIKSIEK